MEESKNKKVVQPQQEYQDDQQEAEVEQQQHGGVQKKKKKKKRKSKRRHPPQYYQQLKIEKQNLKRQKQWNDRFAISGALQPDFTKVSKKKLRLKSLKRVSETKIKADAYHTFTSQSQNKAKPSKSFNIRVMSKKQQNQPVKKQNTEVKKSQKEKTEKQENNQKIIQKNNQKKIQDNANGQKQQKQKQSKITKQQQQHQNLIHLVEHAHQQMKFPQCHKDILIDIIRKSKKKIIKSFVHAQIARLKSKTSCVTNLQNALNKRENLIVQFKQSNDNINQEKVSKYRVTTLRVIEQILKWKEQLENTYLEQTGIKPKLTFLYREENYLISISKDLNQRGLFEKLPNDPFLLGFGTKEIQYQLLIKIRACQMLLLQQQMDNY